MAPPASGMHGADSDGHHGGKVEPSAFPDTPSPEMLRRAFGSFATGVAVVGALGPDGEMAGMTVNSLTSVSINPPLILFCPARSLIAFDVYAAAQHFSVSILPKQSEAISNHFARSGIDKWKAIPHRLSKNGAPYLVDALTFMECAVIERYPAGDHLIVLGRVVHLSVASQEEPLLFFRSRYCSLDQSAHPVEPGTQSPFEPWG